MACTIVRLIIYEDSPFEDQWDDQVQGHRKEDWREFMAGKVRDMKLMGIAHPYSPSTFVASASLQFMIVVLPGKDPNMG